MNDELLSLHEAAGDLLRARDKDVRTVGYRADLWDCLRAILDGSTPATGLIEALLQVRVDILTVLGALRDQMPAEAVEIFQRIAKDCTALALCAAALRSRAHPLEGE